MNEPVGSHNTEIDPRFATIIAPLPALFSRLVNSKPVKVGSVPRNASDRCVYLMSESGIPLYVGRTRRLRQRMRNHSNASSQHNQAVFAFRLACESLSKGPRTYSGIGTRRALAENPEFSRVFGLSKTRVREMELRYVEVTDPLHQTLLEIYAAIVLQTPYNDFDTH
jgi:hypothetical protein